MMDSKEYIAYFTMEIGLESAIPTYAGGLGILAGDTVRAAADLEIPLIVVTMLYRKGYFRQKLDNSGMQTEEPADWPVNELLQEMTSRCTVEIEGRKILLRAWRYEIVGASGYRVPIYLLDTGVEENSDKDRVLTDHLYGGDEHYRLCQEIVLGIGGIRMLRALGYNKINRYHMNEGHSALLTWELAYEVAQEVWEMAYEPIKKSVTREIVLSIKPKCVFTTHTPVPAGHDKFAIGLIHQLITGYDDAFAELECDFCPDSMLDMTRLALDNSHYINGVAKRHGEITRERYAEYKIDSITNGIHAGAWASPPIEQLFDERIPGWREDNSSLRYALKIPKHEIWRCHQEAKARLLSEVSRRGGIALDQNVLTLGFARRATLYKRADLLFFDIARLKNVVQRCGAIQIVYAGKAHPSDAEGKNLIKHIFQLKHELRDTIKIVYLEDYNMDLAKILTAGVDLWLNTPLPPLEASGTSGMKAALNGVPSLSMLDGWWLEGCIEGVTGWAIGSEATQKGVTDLAQDALSLYNKLEMTIIPMFYNEPDRYADIMRNAIALNGSFFNTERMLNQYISRAYYK